jgi:hypothetical protein
MKSHVLRVALALVPLTVLIPAVVLSPRSALACTPGPDFNPVAGASIVAEGYITDWWVTETDDGSGEPLDIALRLDIHRQWTGAPREELVFVDYWSLSRWDGEEQWVGASGSCRGFGRDPRGLYVVLALFENEQAELVTSNPSTFYMGDGGGGEQYNRAIERVLASLALLPPESGLGGAAQSGRSPWQSAGLGGLVAVGLVGAALTLVRSRRPR